MIYRSMFAGYSPEPEKVILKENTGCYTCLSRNNNWLYLYVESNTETVDPNTLAEGPLVAFPDGSRWEQIDEIFHYSKPMTAQQWKRKVENKKPYVRLGRLLPDKISSYIYYHYQLQEERPGDNKKGNRYGVIYLHRDFLLFYSELPGEMETEPHAPTLSTHDSPREIWGEVMQPHFNGEWCELPTQQFTDFIDF